MRWVPVHWSITTEIVSLLTWLACADTVLISSSQKFPIMTFSRSNISFTPKLSVFWTVVVSGTKAFVNRSKNGLEYDDFCLSASVLDLRRYYRKMKYLLPCMIHSFISFLLLWLNVHTWKDVEEPVTRSRRHYLRYLLKIVCEWMSSSFRTFRSSAVSSGILGHLEGWT